MSQGSSILIIEDDDIMAECLAKACVPVRTQIFPNAIEAMAALAQLSSRQLPKLILLDVLLDGPDGFTFLNELVSYQDTVQIPIVLVSTLDLAQQNLSSYGVVGVLNKSTMQPAEIQAYVQQYC